MDSFLYWNKIFNENKMEAKEWHDQNPLLKKIENLIIIYFGRGVSWDRKGKWKIVFQVKIRKEEMCNRQTSHVSEIPVEH